MTSYPKCRIFKGTDKSYFLKSFLCFNLKQIMGYLDICITQTKTAMFLYRNLKKKFIYKISRDF